MNGYWFEFNREWYEILEAGIPDKDTFKSVMVHARKLNKTFHIMRIGVGEKVYTNTERLHLENERTCGLWTL